MNKQERLVLLRALAGRDGAMHDVSRIHPSCKHRKKKLGDRGEVSHLTLRQPCRQTAPMAFMRARAHESIGAAEFEPLDGLPNPGAPSM